MTTLVTDAVAGRSVLVTGARGGIGRALVDAFLAAGASSVVAADRTPGQSPWADDSRVVQAVIDVARPESIATAAQQHGKVDIVVNNAGVNSNRGIFEDDDGEAARREIEVNYLGALGMLRAFGGVMRQRGAGAFVQILSFTALANIPAMGSYSASKAAARSLIQAARAELSPFGVRVIGVYPRVVDTVMTAHMKMPKTSPDEVAAAVLAALRGGATDVFPGNAAASWQAFVSEPAAIERDNAARLPETTRALLASVAGGVHR